MHFATAHRLGHVRRTDVSRSSLLFVGKQGQSELAARTKRSVYVFFFLQPVTSRRKNTAQQCLQSRKL